MNYDPSRYWSRQHESEEGLYGPVGYSALGEGFNRVSYHKRRLPALEGLVDDAAIPVETVLEVGVGTGAYWKVWQRLGAREWTGLDISQKAISRLRNRFPDQEFHRVDVAEPGWRKRLFSDPDPRFDLIAAIDVLYHLIDDDQFVRALEALGSCVEEGGALVVSDVFVQKAQNIAPHVRRRPLEFYRRVLGDVGLRFCGRRPVFAILGDPIIREGLHPLDVVLRESWRLVQKLIRTVPRRHRNGVGKVVASMLVPVDRLLCSLGCAEGVNLELAAFCRS